MQYSNKHIYNADYCPSHKHIWETEEIAEEAMQRSIRHFKSFDFLNVYKCKWCEMWHVGRSQLYGKK